MSRAVFFRALASLALFFIASPGAIARESALADLGFRARFSGLYGNVNYTSASVTSNSTTAIGGTEWGGRVELEKWFNNRLGMLFEGEHISGDLNTGTVESFHGKPLAQQQVFGALGLKLLGSSNSNASASELVVFAGPGIEFFSDMRSYTGKNFYDLARVNVFGARAAARARIAFDSHVLFEFSAAGFTPVSLLGQPKSVLQRQGTRCLLGTVSLEYLYDSGVGFGGGYFYEINRLEYQNTSDLPADTVDFNVSAPFVFVRFGF
ncbi:MAG: hypothetical protein HY074_19660 [Deltaproteobacteria bacterium]|nr:hypothetical protein [Deltaproteobacteria bacterium]